MYFWLYYSHTGVLDMHFSSRNGLSCCHISWYHFSFHVEQNHYCKTHFSKPTDNEEIEKRSNTDSDLLYICLDCWTHPAGLTSLETGEICRFAKQNSNNILLHVHMEGKVLSIFFICFWAGFTLWAYKRQHDYGFGWYYNCYTKKNISNW